MYWPPGVWNFSTRTGLVPFLLRGKELAESLPRFLTHKSLPRLQPLCETLNLNPRNRHTPEPAAFRPAVRPAVTPPEMPLAPIPSAIPLKIVDVLILQVISVPCQRLPGDAARLSVPAPGQRLQLGPRL